MRERDVKTTWSKRKRGGLIRVRETIYLGDKGESELIGIDRCICSNARNARKEESSRIAAAENSKKGKGNKKIQSHRSTTLLLWGKKRQLSKDTA